MSIRPRILVFGTGGALSALLAASLIGSPESRAQEGAPPPGASPGASPGGASRDWRRDWEVEEGLALRVDAEGFRMPTAIAAVPSPGPGPKDPLYFVTELRGAVKVVTNDRSVHTFAEGFFRFRPDKELPAIEGESGLGAICLDPARGHVFVTFVYQDSAGTIRNGIVRFETTPGTFAITPRADTSLSDLLAPWESTISHQIGSCRVSGDHLFVSVADGRQTRRSQDTTALLGKLLRLTLDGRPAPGNPFRPAPPRAGDTAAAPNGSAAVWAYGFRNPFGMTVVDGVPYVADNGSGIDRFIRIRPGENYLWDGTDRSIGLRGDVVITPSVGPAHVAYVPETSTVLPDSLRRAFYVALSAPRVAGILGIPFDVRAARPLGSPRYLVRYRGGAMQILSGIALGGDGLYFAPILPDSSGRTVVLRLAHDPANAHPHVLLENKDATTLIEARGCRGCHRMGQSNTGGEVGPSLHRDSLRARLAARLPSPEYARQVAEVDSLDRQPFSEYRDERRRILEARGEEQLHLYVRTKLLDPRFDNPSSGMPDPELTEADATVLARALLGDPPKAGAGGEGTRARAIAFVRSLVPRPPRVRHLALFGMLGFVAGGVVGLGLGRARRRR